MNGFWEKQRQKIGNFLGKLGLWSSVLYSPMICCLCECWLVIWPLFPSIRIKYFSFCLTYFTRHNTPPSPSMLLQVAKFHSLWLSSIPVCVCVCVCVYIYIYMHHIFTHSSVDGHVGCFHTLVFVDNAAINIGVHLSFWISAFIFCFFVCLFFGCIQDW